MNLSIQATLIYVAAVALLSGCGGATRAVAKTDLSAADTALVHHAVAAGEWAAVKTYCDGGFKRADGKRLHKKAQMIACDERDAHKQEVAIAALRNPNCSEITTVWEDNKAGIEESVKLFKTVFPKMAVKIAKCGKVGYVFREMLHWGPHTAGALGRKALEAMDRAGVEVEKAYLTWLSKQTVAPYTHKVGGYALDHYLNWRLQKGGTIDCKPYVEPWSVFDGGDEMAWIYVFYRHTNCTAAADWVAKGLVNSRPQTRHRACMTLGLIGNTRHIGPMIILAKTDDASTIVGRKKVYWVRDMCRQAVGRIQMR